MIEPAPPSLYAETPLGETEEALARARNGVLPVVEHDETYLGVLTARAAAEALADDRAESVPVRELVHPGPIVTTATALADVLELLIAAEGPGLPVLDRTGTRLHGWITHQSLLAAMHTAQIARIAGH